MHVSIQSAAPDCQLTGDAELSTIIADLVRGSLKPNMNVIFISYSDTYINRESALCSQSRGRIVAVSLANSVTSSSEVLYSPEQHWYKIHIFGARS
jgi:hypothetical protein